MSRHALTLEQRTGIAGHIDKALAELREVLTIGGGVVPLLPSAYRALAELRTLRDIAEQIPIREDDR